MGTETSNTRTRALRVLASDESNLGVSLHLSDEAVGRQAQFGNAGVPDVFDQRADFIGFGDVVGSTTETHAQANNSQLPWRNFFGNDL